MLIWPAALAGAGLAGAMSLVGQERANRQTRELTREQMAFQERMSSTSWQRGVEDMRLAGINPMLAFSQGGASSPGGASAKMEDVIGPAVSSAMHMMRMKKELKVMDAQAYKTEAEGHFADAQAKIANYGTDVKLPTGRTRHVPYRALGNQADYMLRLQQGGLTAAQRSALEISPFGSKFIGTDVLQKARELFGGFKPRYGGIKWREKN